MTAIMQSLSSALLHLLWQGLVIAILFWMALFLLRKRSAPLRYAIGCVALALLVLMPIFTTLALYQQPAAAAENITVRPDLAGGLATVPPPASFNWLQFLQTWAVPVWARGVFLFSLRMAWGCAQIAALRRNGEAIEAQLRAAFTELAARMGVTRPVLVLLSNVTDSPSVTGWLRPVVLLPVAAIAGLTPDQLEAVLAHELAHIRRHDYLVNLLQLAAETLLFYHPAVWWISSRIRHERELCCDDLAVRTCGGALPYARALTALEKIRAPRPALALGSTDGPLFHRIRRLLTGGGEYGPSKLSGAIALTLGLACLALCVNWARGQEPVRGVAIFAESSQDADGVTVNTAGATVLHRPSIEYPEMPDGKRAEGTVAVEATLNATGSVIDARVLSGPDELRKVSLTSVLNWHFSPAGITRHPVVQISFHPLPAEAKREREERVILTTREADGKTWTLEANRFEVTRQLEQALKQLAELESRSNANQQINEANQQINEARARVADLERRVAEEQAYNHEVTNFKRMFVVEENVEDLAGRKLIRIDISGLPEQARKDLFNRISLHLGDTLTAGAVEAAGRAVRQFDEHLEINYGREPEGVILRIHPVGQ